MAFAWFGGQCVAMLRRRFGERGIGLVLDIGRQKRSASREARNADIMSRAFKKELQRQQQKIEIYMNLGNSVVGTRRNWRSSGKQRLWTPC